MGSAPAVAAETSVFDQAPLPGANMNVRNLFRLRCATCHGPNGEGTAHVYPNMAPPLKGNPFVMNAPVAVLVGVIRKGREGRQRLYHDSPYSNMPPFGVEIVPDADELANFLKTDLQK
jgi:mono/diheme cytochrome c family protein